MFRALREGLDACVDFGLRSFELDPALDMAGDSRYLSLSAGVVMNIEVSENAEMDIVTDLYGTRRDSSLVTRDVVLTGALSRALIRPMRRSTLTPHSPSSESLTSVCKRTEAVEHLPGETSASVGAMVSVLCEGDDGAFYNPSQARAAHV